MFDVVLARSGPPGVVSSTLTGFIVKLVDYFENATRGRCCSLRR